MSQLDIRPVTAADVRAVAAADIKARLLEQGVESVGTTLSTGH